MERKYSCHLLPCCFLSSTRRSQCHQVPLSLRRTTTEGSHAEAEVDLLTTQKHICMLLLSVPYDSTQSYRPRCKQSRRRNRREIVIIYRPNPSTAITINSCSISDGSFEHLGMVSGSPAVSLCSSSDCSRYTLEIRDLADIFLISLEHRRTRYVPTSSRDSRHERTYLKSAFCRATEWCQALRFR